MSHLPGAFYPHSTRPFRLQARQDQRSKDRHGEERANENQLEIVTESVDQLVEQAHPASVNGARRSVNEPDGSAAARCMAEKNGSRTHQARAGGPQRI